MGDAQRVAPTVERGDGGRGLVARVARFAHALDHGACTTEEVRWHRHEYLKLQERPGLRSLQHAARRTPERLGCLVHNEGPNVASAGSPELGEVADHANPLVGLHHLLRLLE